MRIYTAVRHSVDPMFYYGGLWSSNFYPALRHLGHEIVESRVDLLPASKFMQVADDFTPSELETRSRLTEQIVEEVRNAHRQQPLQLFLSYFYNAHFDPSGFAEIARLGIPTVNFYCNSIYQFHLVSAISPVVDFAWHAERDARPLYLAVGANPIWLQMAADPVIYRPTPNVLRIPKACFVGQRYADRDRWMAELISAKVPVAIFGAGWRCNGSPTSNGTTVAPAEYLGRKTSQPASFQSYRQVLFQNIHANGIVGGVGRTWRQSRYKRQTQKLSALFADFSQGVIPFERMCAVFSEYEVILNFSNVWGDGRPGSRLIPHVRLRDFEAPMSRTCYLTGYTDEIAEFYEPEKEIVTYRSPAELVDKTRYYLSHPDEAERIREAGYRRALRDHTWVERFKKLFAAIGAK